MGTELIAKLGINEADFTRGLAASEQGLAQSQEKVKLLAAEMALLEQRMASGKTDEMVQQHTKLQDSLRATKAEATAAAKQLAALNAIKPAAAPAQDDSAAYEAHLRKIDERERGLRAQEAADNTRLAMPMASAPRAVINVAEGAAEGAGAAAAGAGLSRMGKMELGHVGRSLAGSVAAGAPIDRALEMEAPRIISVLGEMGLGMSMLLPIFGALAAVVAPAVAAFAVFNENRAASKTRQSLSEIGENETNLGDLSSDLNNSKLDWQSRRRRFQKRNRQDRLEFNKPDNVQLPTEDSESAKDLDKDIEDAQKRIEAAEAQRRTKMDKFARFWGGGLKRSSVQDAVAQREQLVGRRDDEQERDQGFAQREFDGDPNVEADRLKKTRDDRMSSIQKDQDSRKINDGPKQLALAQESYDLSMKELARRQEGTKAAVALEESITSAKRAGYQVDLQVAQARLNAAQELLKNGPKEGDEHAQLQAAANAAQLEVEAAQKATREKTNQADLETKIANLRGSSDQVRKATLDLERANIERKLGAADTKADELPGLNADRARNQQQQDEFAKQQKLRAIDTGEKEDKAHAGRGFADELDLLKKELGRTGDKRGWNQSENGNDASFNADLDTHVTELTRAIDDLTFAENSRLTALQNEGKQIRNRGYQPTEATKDDEIDDKYNKQISEERHGKNNPDVIAQLEQNRDDEKKVVAVDEASMTPAEREARAKKNDTRGFREQQVDNLRKRQDEVDDANNVGGYEADAAVPFPTADQVDFQALPSLPNRLPEIQAGAQNAGKGDVASVDNEGIISAINNPTWASKLTFQNRA